MGNSFKGFWLILAGLILCGRLFAADYNIKDYGAVSDGKTMGTAAIQKAIDDCAMHNGGRVIVPNGEFLTGTIHLKNNVELHLETGATLLGSTNRADYPPVAGERGLVFGINVSHAAITGTGEINGNGKAFFKGDNAPDRPFLVMFKNSNQINVSGITLKNSAFWTFRLLYNNDVNVNGIRIYSHVNFNNDGIDIDSKNVVVANCMIDTDDDALCFKSDSAFICQNVTVSNCILASNCNFIKMGTSSVGGFKNISISNCVLRKASESNFRFWNKNVPGITEPITGIAGIALEVVDGGVMDQINISNITMDGVQTPVFIRLGNRKNATGTLKNVIISNIIAKTYSRIACSVTAVPGFYVDNVVLKDMLIDLQGGGTLADTIPAVPEKEKEYPENRMFGVNLPAYGFYIRHVKGLTLDNITLKLAAADARSALYLEDATDVRVNNLQAEAPRSTQPLIQLNQVSGMLLSGYASNKNIPLLLNLKGNRTGNISLTGNSLNQVQQVYTKAIDVKNDALKIN